MSRPLLPYARGAIHVLEKPLRPIELLDAIQEAVAVDQNLRRREAGRRRVTELIATLSQGTAVGKPGCRGEGNQDDCRGVEHLLAGRRVAAAGRDGEIGPQVFHRAVTLRHAGLARMPPLP